MARPSLSAWAMTESLSSRWLFAVAASLMLAIAAVQQARGLSQLLSARMAVPPAPPPSMPETSGPTPVVRRAGARVEGLLGVSKAPAQKAAEVLSDELARCGGMRLAATAVEPSGARGLAVVEHTGGSALVWLGERVAGKRMVALRVDAALLEDERGERCLVQLVARDAAPAAAPVAAGPAGSAGSAPGSLSESLRGMVEQAGERVVRVDRKALDLVRERLGELGRTSRVVPESEGGRQVGLRLLSIRPGSPLPLLGLAEGDVITKVNGFELSSPEAMLTAYARLGAAERYQIEVRRGGRPMTVDVDVR